MGFIWSLSPQVRMKSVKKYNFFSKVRCDDQDFELVIHLELPNQYPSLEAPNVSFICSGLSENVNTYLNKYLTKKLAREFNPNGVLLETVIWIQVCTGTSTEHDLF